MLTCTKTVFKITCIFLYCSCIVLFRFDTIPKPVKERNEFRQCYATQYQDVIIQYQEECNFATVKTSSDFKDLHLNIPKEAPLVSPEKANVQKGYVISQEPEVYRTSEGYKISESEIGLTQYILMYKSTPDLTMP